MPINPQCFSTQAAQGAQGGKTGRFGRRSVGVNMTPLTIAAAATDLQTRLVVTPDEVFLVKLLGAVLALIASAYWAVGIFDMLRRKPPAHETFASRDELRACTSHCAADIARVEKLVEAIQNDRKESVKILHGKIDALSASMSAEVKELTKSVNRVIVDYARALGKLEGRAEEKARAQEEEAG